MKYRSVALSVRPASAAWRLVLASASLLAALAPAPGRAGGYRALVIGNDAYEGESSLGSCVNDAKAVKEWLLSVGYQEAEIELLTDARRANMSAALARLVERSRAASPDQVVLYYSGHGAMIPDDRGEGNGKDGYSRALVGIDPYKTWDELNKAILRDDEFFRAINDLAASSKQVVVILDSCYSGGMARAVRSKGLGLERKPKLISAADLRRKLGEPPVRSAGPGVERAVGAEINAPPDGHSVVLLLSSNPYQESMSGPKTGCSAFTEILLGGVGLEHREFIGQDGTLGLTELRDRLRERLATLPQNPVTYAVGLPPGVRFMPDVFPDPVKPKLRAAMAEVVEKLLTAPASSRVNDWSLVAASSVPGPIQVGTRFALQVQARRDGYLVIFTVAPSGKVVVLDPNRFHPTPLIRANRNDSFPYRNAMRIDPPAGREIYHVYWLESNPFDKIRVGLFGEKEPMLIGSVEDLARRLQARGGDADAARIRDALVRGDPADWLRDNPGPNIGPWTRAIVTVESIER
jgi:hypothetical protein